MTFNKFLKWVWGILAFVSGVAWIASIISGKWDSELALWFIVCGSRHDYHSHLEDEHGK
jgi:hypothetical protein